MMTPGTNSMLRARRKDVDVRPNRLLDRTASRGMLYENEELRLRTININADLEKGQQYIKKLRRENNQLRREIWSLRDQYDKLESMLKNQDQEQVSIEEIEDDQDGNDNDEPETLSIVEEENECEIENEDSEDQSKNNSTEILDNSCSNSEIENLLQQFPDKVNLETVVDLITAPVKNDIGDKKSANYNEDMKMKS